MKLVKIGQVIFNFDQVAYIKDRGAGALMVELVGGKCLEVIGGADDLRSWLSANLTAPSASSTTTGSTTGTTTA